MIELVGVKSIEIGNDTFWCCFLVYSEAKSFVHLCNCYQRVVTNVIAIKQSAHNRIKTPPADEILIKLSFQPQKLAT